MVTKSIKTPVLIHHTAGSFILYLPSGLNAILVLLEGVSWFFFIIVKEKRADLLGKYSACLGGSWSLILSSYSAGFLSISDHEEIIGVVLCTG